MNSILDNIPPLPSAPVTTTEALICPWCRCIHEGDFMVDGNGVEHQEVYLCGCGGRFTVMPDAESDDLVTEGVRTETDLKYLEALGISEIDVHRHHFPEED